MWCVWCACGVRVVCVVVWFVACGSCWLLLIVVAVVAVVAAVASQVVSGGGHSSLSLKKLCVGGPQRARRN